MKSRGLDYSGKRLLQAACQGGGEGRKSLPVLVAARIRKFIETLVIGSGQIDSGKGRFETANPLIVLQKMTTTPSLLIVDDSRMSRMLIRAIVTQLRPDWVIIEAASGDEALAQVEAHQPCFVSMDVNMPGMSGLEAAGRIRIRHPEIKIAICTANIQASTEQESRKLNLYFIKKPVTEASITQMVACFEE